MQTARPHGRSLSDFGKLSFVEEELLRAAAGGERYVVSLMRPEAATEQNSVRADFIRFLALGGDDANPVHERGVWLMGAWIEGVLNLDFCNLPSPLRLRGCHLNQLTAYETQLPRLDLQGTWVAGGIYADGIRVAGEVFLRYGFTAIGAVRLLGAQIGGALECTDGRFDNKGADALSVDRAIIKGGVFLNGKFNATGAVRLPGAYIGGHFACTDGRFDNKGADALTFDGATIKGGAFLNGKFTAIGAVRLPGAQIGDAFECADGSFCNEGANALSFDRANINGAIFLDGKFNATGAVRLLGAQIGSDLVCTDGCFENQGADALALQGATIKGALHLRGRFTAKGRLLFTAAQIGSLIDNANCWPEPSQLELDGLTIGGLVGGAPTSGAARVEWLKRQRLDHLTSDFRPQPWEEMIRVLRAMGHEEDAKIVAIAKQEQMRAAGKFVGVARDLHWLWGALAGYGYRPSRLLGVMAGLWLVCATAFAVGAQHGLVAPTNPIIHNDPALRKACAPSGWSTCPLPDEYTTFSPWYYSLDVILPVIDLQQEADWAPVVTENGQQIKPGVLLRWLMWFEILAGWLGSLLLIAIFTNLVKKD